MTAVAVPATATAATPTAATGQASSITESSATLNATVNPNGSEVTKCTFEYGTTTLDKTTPCTPLPGSGSSPEAVTAAISGLSANTTYHFKIVAENALSKGEGSEETFKTSAAAVTPPTAVTGKASSITESGATLNATVNPNGTTVTKCTFEYGTTTLDKTAPCTPLPGSGSSPEAVTAAISGLSANTTYHFKIVAENASSKGEGSEETFKTSAVVVTPPAAVTGNASSITETSATLNATVNPNGTAVTKCSFEYGTETSYGKTAPCATLPSSGMSPVGVTAAISGLSANTTYHFRIVAENATTKGEGNDATFKTLAPPVPIIPVGPSVIPGPQPPATTVPPPAAGGSAVMYLRPQPPNLRVVSKTCRRSGCTVEVLASAGTGLAAVARIEARLTFLQPYPCHEGALHFTCTRLVSRWVNARATAAGRFSIVASHLGLYPYTLMLTAIDEAGLYQLQPIRVALTVRRPAGTKR